MTTGDCCHLPGSLCDCPGSAALSKSVEDSDIGRPQYVTQVTAKDGRLLSTVIKALGAQSDGPICRICHEGGNGEGLLSPCDCTGTLGTVHKSCLEKWLSSSNTSYCELCHTEFVVERRPRPLTEVPLSSCLPLTFVFVEFYFVVNSSVLQFIKIPLYFSCVLQSVGSHPSFVLSAYLIIMLSTPTSWSLIKMLNITGARTDLRGTSLETSLQSDIIPLTETNTYKIFTKHSQNYDTRTRK
uniref:E3 ubiquitin-protein ligase MARCHF2 n=1 Tax=Gopherus agassizii TaxID=38772 RepID=A0A452GRX7_9SAUR